jgi:hypothetical protein
MLIYYTLNADGVPYDRDSIEDVEGEKVYEFSKRVATANGFEGRDAAVYPHQQSASTPTRLQAIGRAKSVADVSSLGGSLLHFDPTATAAAKW